MAVSRAEPKKVLTEDEFMRLPHDGPKVELVDGEVIEVPTGGIHGDIAVSLILLIGVIARAFGRVFDSGTGFRMASKNIRSPDVSFMRTERLPDGKPPEGFVDGAPALCIEVISSSEERREMFRKVSEYFDSGAQQVWHVYPETRRVVIYSLTDDIRLLGPDDELTAGGLIPGFSCQVAEIFPV